MSKTTAVIVVGGLIGAIGLAVWKAPPAPVEASERDTEAVERTRDTVRMLDDIYKTTVVLITDKYVHDITDFPAGSAAVALFKSISEKGWHEVRLIDATGQPFDEKNVAWDEFEKTAVRNLKAGDGYYERVVEQKGKPFLRAATPVPVVMDKCVMCHDHYKDAKKGEAIGAIVYKVPIR